MICERCGNFMPEGSLTCDHCGSFLGKGVTSSRNTGVRAIRQGRVSAATPTVSTGGSHPPKEIGDFELSDLPVEREEQRRSRPASPMPPMPTRGSSRPDTRRGVPVNARGRVPVVPRSHGRVKPVKRHQVNWMLVGVICVVMLIGAFAGYTLYMRNSDAGQRTTARRNILNATEEMLTLAQNTKDVLVQEEREALIRSWSSTPAQAYWLVGSEYLDFGDIPTAIIALRLADTIDPENYDGLLELATAYELGDQDDLAEAIYLNLAENIAPFRSEAYTALIRMYQEQDRGPEAAEMMRVAYNNTERETFRLQREDYIPETPQVNLTAGRYVMTMEEDVFTLTSSSGTVADQNIILTSPQGYEIYYTMDNEVTLPEGGTRAETGVIIPKEGSVTLRAVCVSGDLVSDPLSVNYTFAYPTPPAPQCNLAPNTYASLREVKLRPGTDVTAKEAEFLTYYYTIDGSTPTIESPVYDGTPIKLPTGRVTFKAVCVNQYGKMSPTLEVGYKFTVKPYLKEIYQEEDIFEGFTLNKTVMADFTARFGQPQEQIETTYLFTTGQARRLNYSWGHAVFLLENGSWNLVRVEMHSHIATAPRGVSFGSSESDVVALFKDFGQLQSPNGNRGLYYEYPRVGQVIQNADGTRTVQYTLITLESKIWVLNFILQNDRVVTMEHYYQP